MHHIARQCISAQTLLHGVYSLCHKTVNGTVFPFLVTLSTMLMLCLLQVLLSKGVEESKILFLSLIAAPEGIHRLCSTFPRLKVITSDIDEGIAPDFQVVPGKNMSIHTAVYHI